MPEKRGYAAKIRTKGLEHTGCTEDIAKSMYGTLGRTTLAIVEVEHVRQINDEESGRQVECKIIMFEPSTSADLDAHLRQLTKTLHQNRVLNSDSEQLAIDTQDDLEPSVEEVMAAQRAHAANQPHVFEPDPGDDPDDRSDACMVCGEELEHDLHAVVPAAEPGDDEPSDVAPAEKEPVSA